MEKKKSSLYFLIDFIYRHALNKTIWVLLLLLIITYVSAGRALPILFGGAIDKGLLPRDIETFKFYCFIFLSVGFLRTLSGFMLFFGVFKESNFISYTVRKNLYKHTLKLKLKYFDQNPSGKILTRLTNDTKSFQSLLGEGVVGIVINIIELISILIALTFQSLHLAFIIFLTFPAVLFLGLKLAKKIQKEFYIMKERLSELNTYLADSLNGYTIIKSYQLLKARHKDFDKISKDYFHRNIKISYIYALLWPQIELFQLLASLICFTYGIYLIQNGSLEIGNLVAFILLIQGFFHPLRFILERINQFQNGYTSSKRIFNILEEKEEEDPSTGKLTKDFRPAISITDMSFYYEKEKPIFKNFNLEIPALKTTAITGRTGSGKTTLISLLQRLYTPQKGKILIGENDIKCLSLKDLRSHLCVVRQEDFIFSGSLAENVALESPNNISNERVKKALRFAEIQKDLDFKVSTSGNNLSPGERQLLSFARAYYLSPKILVFDEATSFIDEQTEAILQKKSLELFKNKTVIIIAHKKTTIEMCDNVVEIIPRPIGS